MSALLPEGFEALEPFVDQWAVKGTANRARRRLDSTEEERVAFFEAAKDLVEPALKLLDRKELGQFDEKEERLMNLILGVAHIALAVELLGPDEPKHAADAKFMTITRAVADQ